METIILQRAFIIALISIAWWCCCLNGMIFGKINDLPIPEWIKNPLYACPVCWIPYGGTLIYHFFFHGDAHEYPIVLLVAMGFCAVFVKIKK